MILNGEEILFDIPPQIIDGRTMVPVRTIFEALGADVYWIDFQAAEQTVLAVKNAIKIMMAVGQKKLIAGQSEQKNPHSCNIVPNLARWGKPLPAERLRNFTIYTGLKFY